MIAHREFLLWGNLALARREVADTDLTLCERAQQGVRLLVCERRELLGVVPASLRRW